MDISLIICTHNPRADYLERTLKALENQTLAMDRWELLLIDNASAELLAGKWDLGWHPQARVVREELVGLTHARIRGILESRAGTIVFVDDDNVLDPDYLQHAYNISNDMPFIGVWGGSIKGEYEAEPSNLSKEYLSGLAIEEIDRDYWSNIAQWSRACPFGAGMCVRRSVALTYRELVSKEPLRSSLGRRGLSLSSGEDTDLAFSACDLGYGIGRFHCLKLIHLIPAERVSKKYLIRLHASFSVSNEVLAFVRCGKAVRPAQFYFLSLIKLVLHELIDFCEHRDWLRFRICIASWVALQKIRRSLYSRICSTTGPN
jgi:glycosyltransferase involved in cell wall biosynthesis